MILVSVCKLLCVCCDRVILHPWSSVLWTQQWIFHREARLVYWCCCEVIYYCVSKDGDNSASSPTKKVCVVRKKLEVPQDDMDGSEVCILILQCDSLYWCIIGDGY